MLQELAIAAAVSVASSWITLGVSIAAGVAAAAAIAARYARPIRAAIEAWQAARNIRAGVKMEADLAKAIREAERLEDLTPAGRLKPKPDLPPKPNLTDTDRAAIDDYAAMGSRLNNRLRAGNMSPEAQAQIDAINAALDKLPPYEGLVTRRTSVPDEVLDLYQPGAKVPENAFTSSSTDPTKFSGPVEFQIMSKTGKSIQEYVPGAYSPEAEVLFKSGTEWQVLDRFVDPTTGRTIIQMTG